MRMGLRRPVGCVAVLVVAVASFACTRPPNGWPSGFRVEAIASGLNLPTSFAFLPGTDDAYITEKAGMIRVLRDGQVRPTPLIDLRHKVFDNHDSGLNNIVLDPNFAENGYIYLAYVYEDPTVPISSPGQTQRVTRLTVTNDVADPASERVILGSVTGAACWDHWRTNDCLPLNGSSHQIDDLLFDSSGRLLVSVGDGAFINADTLATLRAQDVSVLAGKILRIDPATGRGLPENPFGAYPSEMNVSRVYAYGLRNPYRITIRPGTDQIYLGDVGEVTWEEVNVARPGSNFGWPCWEGNERRTTPLTRTFCEEQFRQEDAGTLDITEPAWVYRHATRAGGAAIGGVFYTGDTYPEEYRGDYVFGDYPMNLILRQEFDADGVGTGPPIGFADATGAGAPVAFEMGPDRNLWYLSIYPGELRRVVYDGNSTVPASCPDNQFRVEYFNNRAVDGDPATVRCEATIDKRLYDQAPAPGVQVDDWSFRATGRLVLPGGTYAFIAETNDGKRVWVDGALVIDRWRDADTPTGVDRRTADVRLAAGTHTVVMEYYDRSDDATAILRHRRLGTPPVVQVTAPADLIRVPAGSDVDLAATASDAEDGAIDPTAITIDVSQLHYGGEEPHTHPYASDQPNPGSVVVDDAHAPGRIMFEVRAKVTDSSGIVTVSDPRRICLDGGAVGPCA